MKTYEKYKPSGIEWVGDVPEHWSNVRLKAVFLSERNGIWGDEPLGDDSDVICIRVADFDRGFDRLSRIDNTVRNIAAKDLERRRLECNDLLIEKSGGGEISPVGRVGIYDWTESRAVCSNFIAQVKPDTTKAESRFLFYNFKRMYSIRLNSRSIKQTTGIQNLDTYSYFNERVALPPLEEQTPIADYLDKQTARIDKVVAKKKRLVELLKEERLAIINQAVTRGLDPNTKLKASNIDWLGDIPEHWEVKKLKFICSLLKDGTHLPPARVPRGVPLLSVRNLVDGRYIQFLDDDSQISEEDFDQLEKAFSVKENDIMLAIVGATMGKTSLVPRMSRFTIQRSVAIFRPIDEIAHFRFLFYFFQSDSFQSILWNNTGFSAQPGIYLGSLANFSCTIPPISEQNVIIQSIETKTGKIDATIAKVKKEIGLLNEYRTALISEVVTGKIKVS